MSHSHSCKCKHENVKYCDHCKTVYCCDCNQEWTAKVTTTWYYPYWGQYQGSGTVYAKNVSGAGGTGGVNVDSVTLTATNTPTTQCKHSHGS